MNVILVTLAISLSVVLGGGNAWAAAVEPLTIKFAHAGSPTHPYSVGIQKLTPILEKNSGGAIKLQVFCCAQLGSERELAEGTRLGTINMTSVAAEGALPAWVPELQVFGLPFLIRNRELWPPLRLCVGGIGDGGRSARLQPLPGGAAHCGGARRGMVGERLAAAQP